MAFVRIKRIDGREYYQLVESRRVEGKPRQKVLMHLGQHATVEEALKKWPKEVGGLRRRGKDDGADALREKLDRLRKLRAEGVA